jgi:hypothetical protein
MVNRWSVGGGILAIGLVAGVGLLFIGGLFALTQPVADASSQFLALLGEGKIAEAYTSTAGGFRAQESEASFAKGVKQLGLTDYASVFWHSRQIDNMEGIAEGTVTTKSGTTTPVAIRLVRDQSKWAVVGVRYGGVDLTTIKAAPPVPSETALERLITESLMDLNQAVQTADFTAFHDKLSDDWKKQTTPQALLKAFQGFVDEKIDIGAIKQSHPRVAPPAAVNDNGVLVVAGHYPVQPSRVGFKLKYEDEGSGWKLIGVSVKVGADETSDK